MRLILDDDCESMSGDDDFFSVARTMPLVAAASCQQCGTAVAQQTLPLIPSEVTPWLTAFKAYSIAVLDTAFHLRHETWRLFRAHTNLDQLSATRALACMSWVIDSAVFTWERRW